MLAKANQAISGRFSVVGADGALVDTDSTPTGQLITNGVDDVATITITNAATGKYRWQMTVPNDLSEGDQIQIEISGAIDSISTAGKVFEATIVEKFPGEEVTLEDDAITAAKLAADAGAELAALVESYIINEGDATAVLQAVADKIAADWIAGDASPLAIVAALKADAQWSDLTVIDGLLDTLVARLTADRAGYLDKLNVSGTLAHSDAANTYKADVSGLATAVALTTVGTNVTTLLDRITANLFAGITSMAAWLGVLAGKSPDAGTLAEIQDTDGGTSFDNSTDSLEALRDRGDAAWTTGDGGGGGGGGEEGGVPVTIPIQDQHSNPIPDARVWITADADGDTLVDGAYRTDTSGNVTFTLIDGDTYYLWAQKAGQQAVSGQAFVAVAD